MKKTFFTLGLLTLLLAGKGLSANAAANNMLSKNLKETMRNEIISNIPCPDFVDSNSPINQVKAIVQVSNNGTIKVEEINSANPKLRDYVTSRLQSMQLKTTGENYRFILVMNFEVN